MELRGPEAGPFPLTWGEGNMWESMLAFGPRSNRLNPAGISRVKHPVRVRDALPRIERDLNQFDILRATFDEKRVEQTFQGQARVGVLVCDTSVFPERGRELESGGLHTFLGAGFPMAAFDLCEAPIRIGLLHLDGIITHLILLLSHLPFDGAAYPLLMRPLLAAVEGREVPAPGMRTETLLQYEQSAESVRGSDAVIRRWIDTATRPRPGRGLMSTTVGRYSMIALRSRAAAIAAQVLAVRTRTSTTSVALAALTKTIHRHVDRELSAMLLVCNNRWQPQLKNFVGQTLGTGCCRFPRTTSAGTCRPIPG